MVPLSTIFASRRISPTIRTRQEFQCLPYAGFLVTQNQDTQPGTNLHPKLVCERPGLLLVYGGVMLGGVVHCGGVVQGGAVAAEARVTELWGGLAGGRQEREEEAAGLRGED